MRSKKSLRSKKKRIIYRRRAWKYQYFVRKYLKVLINIIKLSLVFIVLSIVTRFILFSSYFKVSEITVYGTKEFVNPADVDQLVRSNTLGKNIFILDLPELEDKLLKTVLGAKQLMISRDYPDSLVVDVWEREPIAIVHNSGTGSSDYFLIDEEGYILGYTDPEKRKLPIIQYEQEINVGLFIDRKLVPLYLEVTELLIEDQINVSSMSFFPRHIFLHIDNGPEVLIGNEKSKFESVKAVSSLLKQAIIDNKQIERIDLRYDKVIVLFK